MLFSEVLEMWWVGNKLFLREKSIFNKRMMIDVHILPYFGDMEISKIDDVMINNFIVHESTMGNHTTGKSLCYNTILREVGVVGEILNYSYKKGYIKLNPMELIKLKKKEPSREFEIFSPEEVEKLIKLARPKWHGDMILLAYNTGLRKCECFGLQWDDINFLNKWIVVKRSVTAAKPGDRFITTPKTKTSNRVVLLDDRTLNMLAKRYKNRKSDTWVFADKYGELLSPWYNVKYFRTACQKADIPIRRFYDLRHTHITELVEAGIPLPVIQKRAGHSNINMTLHYTHVKTGAQNCIVDILNKRNNDKLVLEDNICQ